jgi:xanthine/uracil permease
MKFTAGDSFVIEKIGLAAILGLVLNLILPAEKSEPEQQ